MAAPLRDGRGVARAVVCAGMALAAMSAPARAADAAAGDPAPVVRSATSLFLVKGMPLAEAMNLSAWTEGLRERIGRQFGLDVPRLNGEPIQIIVRDAEPEGGARVVQGQGWVDGYLEQKLVVYDPAHVDREDILEGLTWLLINRYIIERQSLRQRTEALGSTPDWFAVGVAQHLFPELRAKNADALLDRFHHGGRIPVAEILTREHLPSGRWPIKAACGLFYDWLRETLHDPDRFTMLFDHWAAGERVAADWLGDTFLQRYAAVSLESDWYDWVERQALVKHEVGTVTDEHLRKLHELLLIWPNEHGLDEDADADGILTIKALIDHRDEAWAQAIAANRIPALQQLAAGRSKEFADVVSLYTVFLAATLPPPKSVIENKPPEPPVPVAELRTLLAHAEQAHAELKQRVRSVDRYLDGVERQRTALDEGRLAELTAFLDRQEFSNTPRP